MIFISDTNEHEIFISQITIINDAVFAELEGDITLYEGTTTFNTVTFSAGIVIEGRFTKVKLSSGAIIVS